MAAVERPSPEDEVGPLVLIAEVDRTRGLRGEVVLTVHADDPGRMATVERVLMKEPGGGLVEASVEGVKRLGRRAVVKLSGYDSVESAKSLVGRELFIPLEASTPASEGRYYAYQLMGLEARLESGALVGRVDDILKQGGQTLLVLKAEGKEILIPFVPEICTAVDLEAGTVTLRPPEGLLDL